MPIKVTRNDLKKAFRNESNFDEFVGDVLDKLKGDNRMRTVKMNGAKIISYSLEDNRIYVTISIQCPMCGRENIVKMTLEQYNRWWDNNEYVQNIFPEKSSSEREVLISGICPTCWDKLFS